MTGETKLNGKCLCGAVRVRITPPEPHIGVCHCEMCRRWGGGPSLSLRLVSDPEIEGTDRIVRYASSNWAERGFCRTCGTHLFYFFKPKSGYSFQAGLFDGIDAFDLADEIFVDEKPAYYDFAGEREHLTGAEVMAEAGIGDG